MDDIRYQAFISYAWDNNLSSSLPGPDGSRRGWVQVFHDELNRELVANLSRMLRQGRRDGLLWIDYEQLRGGEPLTPAIRAKLAASRLFVPILSRSCPGLGSSPAGAWQSWSGSSPPIPMARLGCSRSGTGAWTKTT